MSYADFSKRIKSRFGKDVLSITHTDGRHIARLSDGVTIIGNAVASSVLVRWGSGHSAIAAI